MDYLQKHVLEQPIPLDARVPNLTFPAGLDGVIQRALAKRREDRYATAKDFGDALRPYAESYDPRLPSRPSGITAFSAGFSSAQLAPRQRFVQFAFVAAVFLLVGVALTAVALRFVGR
jgi:serine/threonine-protein kinase